MHLQAHMPIPNTCSTAPSSENPPREPNLIRPERDGVSRVSPETLERASSDPGSTRKIGELITHTFTR